VPVQHQRVGRGDLLGLPHLVRRLSLIQEKSGVYQAIAKGATTITAVSTMMVITIAAKVITSVVNLVAALTLAVAADLLGRR